LSSALRGPNRPRAPFRSDNAGTESFANWAAFAADHPTYKIASGTTPFIIADGELGTYGVSDIVLR